MSDMMNNFGLFWNSTNGDRKYNAESFEEWLKKFFTSGVFANECEVTASSGMTVVGATGYANVDGKVRFFRTQEEFTLSPANSRYPRIDTIVIERNNTDREITRKIVTGAYSGDTPVPTPPVRSETVYQLVTAQIYVGAGVTSIAQANITDTRADNAICGYVTGTVTEIDWSQITAQFEEYMQEFRDETETEFYDLLQQMHDLIDQETAGHLQEEINHLNSDISIILGDFATVEPAATASKAYDVGDYLVLNKMFYKVVAAIAQGDALVVDGNIEATNVGAEVASIKSDLATESFTMSNVSSSQTTFFANGFYDRSSKTVRVYISSYSSGGATPSTDVAISMPAKYRPSSNKTAIGYVDGYAALLAITTDGKLIQQHSSAYTNVFAIAEYTLG